MYWHRGANNKQKMKIKTSKINTFREDLEKENIKKDSYFFLAMACHSKILANQKEKDKCATGVK